MNDRRDIPRLIKALDAAIERRVAARLKVPLSTHTAELALINTSAPDFDAQFEGGGHCAALEGFLRKRMGGPCA